MPERWNHNLHYHRLILESVPRPCRRALDVGCGEGTLSRQLRPRVPEVVGIDLDAQSIALARAHRDAADIRYLEDDFLDAALEPGSFDLIVSVAALHQMDAATALSRMRDLLAPGGVLTVIGLVRSRMPVELPLDIAAIGVNWLYRLRWKYWEQPSPARPATLTYEQMRQIGTSALPGVRFRRLLLWRYYLTWSKPGLSRTLSAL